MGLRDLNIAQYILEDREDELDELWEEGDSKYTRDDFDKKYKGEISKSGAAILPSKRARKMPEKIKSSEDKTE